MLTDKVILTDRQVSLDEFMSVVRGRATLEFSDIFCENVRKGRALIDRFLQEGRIIYGVTTGFGENVRYTIDPDDAIELQKRIVRSHSVAVGEPLSEEQCRAIMLQSILNAREGHTGLRLETLEIIRDWLNKGLVPWAPGEGSVGYLSVEGHFVMAYMGEGFVLEDGKKRPAAEAIKEANIPVLQLQCKEGLSLLNGTITVTALAVLALFDYLNIMKNVEICGALCYEALRGTTKALDPRIHAAKNHQEQMDAADNLQRLLEGSEISEKFRDAKVQDCYILRAMPHIHGAAKKLIDEAYDVILDEMNGCSDNPELFFEDDDGVALMCGNFDGSYVGSHADMLTMAAAIAGNEVERSIDRMVNRNLNDGLPAFLVAEPGLNNGFMIPQYTAAGLESEIKILAQPSTIDSISTCANQEDPVSMAYFASKKAGMAVKKLEHMTAIEYMTALQAIDFLEPLQQSPALKAVHDFIRRQIPFVKEDRYLHPDIEWIRSKVASGELVAAAEEVIGKLK